VLSYKGPFINIGGGYNVGAANAFIAVDPKTGMPPRNPQTGRPELLGGIEGGGGFSFPSVSGYVNATYSIPIMPLHVRLDSDEAWQVSVCRLVGMCGQ